MGEKESLEELATLKPGDRVLRRQRRPRGIMQAISQNMAKLLKCKAGKQPRVGK